MTTPPVEAQFMEGPTRIREIFAAYTSGSLPPFLDVLRAKWSMTMTELPNPIKYDAYEPYAVAGDDYPIVGAYIVNDRNFHRVDYDDLMAEEYQAQYESRFFATVKTPTDDQGVQVDYPYEATIKARDKMTTALKMLLLFQPSMGYPEECTILEDTIATDYPDAMLLDKQGKRYAASGIITVTVQLVEKLSRDPLGVAQYLNVNPALM